ncbi:MAG: hypothetical protein FWD36_09505 [Treponema sp.]|nr:hypothetical protein [Treponema sp.]
MPVAQPVYNDLIKVMSSLPEEYAVQVIDFAHYLKAKATQQADIMSNECSICANSVPNAETIAAIQEGRAMMRGEIPAKRFSSLDEMWEDLERHDPELDD